MRQQAKEIALLKKQAGKQGSGESKQQKAQIGQALAMEKQAREEAERRAAQEAKFRQETERKAHIYAWIASFTLSFILIVMFELMIYLIPVSWFMDHRSKYGLQIAIDALLLFTVMGFFHIHLRSWLWGVGILALLSTVLQLL